MYDHSGDWVISFNGEIYNHLEIREYLSKKLNKKFNGKVAVIETILVTNYILGFEKTLECLKECLYRII